MLALVHAEIQLGRAAFPHRPLYVIKADLKDFYPSLSHGLLLDFLARFGLADRDLAFFRRYLEVPLESAEDVVITRSGVPNHRALSDLLGELVLRLLDQYVRRHARVLVVRLLDDIGLITPSGEEAVRAWRAIQEFCRACSLTLNAEKCGAVCIGGGVVPPELPVGRPTWLLLALSANAEWNVNAEAFEAYLMHVRDRLAQAPSVIAWVERYNVAVAYFERALACIHHGRLLARVVDRIE